MSIRQFAHFGPQKEELEATIFPVVSKKTLCTVGSKGEIDCSQIFLREKG